MSGTLRSVVVAVTAAVPVAATSASAASATTITPASAAAWRSRPGLVDGQPTPIMILPIQSVNCGKRFVVIALLDEAKTTTPPCLAIAQDLGGAD